MEIINIALPSELIYVTSFRPTVWHFLVPTVGTVTKTERKHWEENVSLILLSYLERREHSGRFSFRCGR